VSLSVASSSPSTRGGGPWPRPSAASPSLFPAPSSAGSGNGAAALTNPYEALESITCDLSAFPACHFFRVEAIVRPWRVNKIVGELQRNGIRGLTVSEVSGAGMQGGLKERCGGTEFGGEDRPLVKKTRIDIVLSRLVGWLVGWCERAALMQGTYDVDSHAEHRLAPLPLLVFPLRPRDQVDEVVRVICSASYTGEIGDGKVRLSSFFWVHHCKRRFEGSGFSSLLKRCRHSAATCVQPTLHYIASFFAKNL
jgi:nitrogen regulatory protein PII